MKQFIFSAIRRHKLLVSFLVILLIIVTIKIVICSYYKSLLISAIHSKLNNKEWVVFTMGEVMPLKFHKVSFSSSFSNFVILRYCPGERESILFDTYFWVTSDEIWMQESYVINSPCSQVYSPGDFFLAARNINGHIRLNTVSLEAVKFLNQIEDFTKFGRESVFDLNSFLSEDHTNATLEMYYGTLIITYERGLEKNKILIPEEIVRLQTSDKVVQNDLFKIQRTYRNSSPYYILTDGRP